MAGQLPVILAFHANSCVCCYVESNLHLATHSTGVVHADSAGTAHT